METVIICSENETVNTRNDDVIFEDVLQTNSTFLLPCSCTL